MCRTLVSCKCVVFTRVVNVSYSRELLMFRTHASCKCVVLTRVVNVSYSREL